jgi:putative ABC transport system permease protein
MAWRNLGRNRLRTALAALGIVIGVVSICSLGIATVAIEQQATSQLASIGDDVTVRPGEDSTTQGVTEDQVETMRAIVDDATVVPQKSNSTTITSRSGREAQMSVTGVTNAAALYNQTSGDAPERLATGALISNSTVQRLGLERGDPVEYDGQLYRIQGFIAEEGSTFRYRSGELVLPVSALAEQDHYSSVTIIASDSSAATAIAGELNEYFNSEEETVLSIHSFGNAGQVGGFLDTLSMALLGIGGISLVVASVAILNVMLMSTVERRGEIGVLRAVGIRRGEVLRMILTEAMFMGALGGTVGALVSLVIGAVLFHYITGNPLGALAWSSSKYLVYGFGFAVGASVLSGLYPAWKAANDRPVDALRE